MYHFLFFVFYIVLYSGYSKVERRFDFVGIPGRLNAAELNKLCGLVGITSLAWSNGEFEWLTVGILCTHALLSFYLVFGFSLGAYFSSARLPAMLCGGTALGIYATGMGSVVSWVVLVAAILHFVGMELKPGPYKGQLYVRPVGYVGLTLPLLRLVFNFFSSQ